MKIVDTHVHVWDPEKAKYPWLEGDKSILNRTWKLEEIENERISAGIDTGVLVQASGNIEDTDVMFAAAGQHRWIKGIVAWLPLMDPKLTEQLLNERFLNEPLFKGIRHQIHDEKNTEWLLQPLVIESLNILVRNNIPYDVVAVTPQHLETVIKLMDMVPGLRMVIDHLAQPPISSKEKYGRWGELMKELSGNRNIYAKISGLGTASGNFRNRTKEDIKPYIAFALDHFQPSRCFCGGDWPVSMLSASYSNTWQVYKDILNELLPAEEQEKVFYTNAVSFYNL